MSMPTPPPPPQGLPVPPGPPPLPPRANGEVESVELGMIFPPPDVRGIVDKTAKFVAKNGREFERRVLQEQGGNAKFNFLRDDDPYHAYFEMKLNEYQTGQVEVSKPSVPKAIQEMRQREEEKKKKKEELLMLTQYGEVQRGGDGDEGENAEVAPTKPDPDQFVLQHPRLDPLDVDIIKLTAQFVARNGHNFLLGLTARERKNAQFDFLRGSPEQEAMALQSGQCRTPFQYFSYLVESYARCLIPDKEHIARIKENCQGYSKEAAESEDVQSDGFQRIFRRCWKRYQWDKAEEAKRRAKEDREEEERAQLNAIDWHTFTIVETVEFTEEDDRLPLAAPMDFNSQNLVPPVPLAQLQREIPKDESDAMEVDEVDEKPHIPPTPVGPRVEMPSEAPRPPPRAEPQLVVRTDYVRPKKRARPEAATGMQRCPITGQLIPAEDMTRHLKILLLDPKWKEQKDKLLERAKAESALAPESDVETNLALFVTRRPDLFGSVDDEVFEHTAEPTDAVQPPPPASFVPAVVGPVGIVGSSPWFAQPPPPPTQQNAPPPPPPSSS